MAQYDKETTTPVCNDYYDVFDFGIIDFGGVY